MVWSCGLTKDVDLEVIEDKNSWKDVLPGLICYKWNKVELVVRLIDISGR